MKKTASLLIFFLFALQVWSQEKRLKQKDVPASVPVFLQSKYPEKSNLKFFKVHDEDSVFIEATFRSGGEEFAIKFLPDGTLSEIEREIEFSELPADVKAKMESELKARFISYTVTLVEEINPSTDLRYELNVKGRMNEGKSKRYTELYFDRYGKLLEIEIVPLKAIQTAF